MRPNEDVVSARDRLAVADGRPLRRHRFAAGLFAAAILGTGLVAITPTAALADSNEGAFLAHLNSLRAANGLSALTLSGDLTAVARAQSARMAAAGTIFHNANLQTAVSNWQLLGENVGMGPTEAAIDHAFDGSPHHYENEVNPGYTQVGIGTVTDSRGEIFVTVDFRRPMVGATATPPAPAPPRVAAPAPAPQPAPVTAPVASGPSSPPAFRVSAVPRTARAAQTPAERAALAAAKARIAAREAAAAREKARLRGLSDPVARAITFQQTIAALHG